MLFADPWRDQNNCNTERDFFLSDLENIAELLGAVGKLEARARFSAV